MYGHDNHDDNHHYNHDNNHNDNHDNHHDNQDTDGDVLYVWTTLNLRAEHGIGNLYNQTYVLGTMIMILKCHHVVIRSSYDHICYDDDDEKMQ